MVAEDPQDLVRDARVCGGWYGPAARGRDVRHADGDALLKAGPLGVELAQPPLERQQLLCGVDHLLDGIVSARIHLTLGGDDITTLAADSVRARSHVVAARSTVAGYIQLISQLS